MHGFRHGYYMELLLEGKLNEYLHDIDEECHEMLDRIVEKMKVKQGVTEQLKAENQMLWVGKMNNIIDCAEEVVVREVVYV
ncbi:TnpV protein [Coprococcus eutactus]|uniref:TnpV protein n=1 Tax=Coprococcus eutactus TaxID=33043 RepID=UPI0021087623|nr:TnpV protein [Coprococcus eutactus]MCQ5119561.1 TnpV protein [Coprococcus eutactus]MCQ5136499.1 TnpV protein [Coprococcus eutactus]